MPKSRERFKELPKKNAELLLNYAERIRKAWRRDKKGGEPYPLNTASALSELEAKLNGRIPRRLRFVPVPKDPKRLRDILPEYVVRQVHEYLHEEPFTDALDQLHTMSFDRALARIEATVTTALAVDLLGAGMLPKPRGNWIHRQILKVVRAAHPGKLSDTEMAELFNQLCPCGIKHNREAMKKFRSRWSRRRR